MNIYLSHISAWLFWIWWSKMNAIPLGLFHSGKCFARDRMPSFSLPTVSIIKNAAGSKREVRQILNANGQSVRQLLVRAGIGTGADGCLYVCVPYVKGRRCSEQKYPLPPSELRAASAIVCESGRRLVCCFARAHVCADGERPRRRGTVRLRYGIDGWVSSGCRVSPRWRSRLRAGARHVANAPRGLR